ncbi:MAG: DUF3034 family protein [Rhodanobacteraceae bacterium]|nr:DUF3034 family protein [Rhodanobacteraceae bacterium]
MIQLFARVGVIAALFAAAVQATPVAAQTVNSTGGRLLLTGGVSQIEGAGGGGLTPWALIGGYGSRDQIGANAFYTRVDVDDYALDTYGAMVGLYDRVELSYARQSFDTQDVGAALGLGRGFEFEQDIYGAKLRLIGDAVLDQDRWLPQIAIGVQHKRNHQGDVVRAVGAKDDSGTDFYLAATKIYLDQSLLLNATLRYTEANQIGILDFGGDQGSGSFEFEGSAAYLLTRQLALGAEFRSKPDQLGIADEDLWWDIFLAWAPNRHVSVTLAYVDLGNVVVADQSGTYLSVQVGF